MRKLSSDPIKEMNEYMKKCVKYIQLSFFTVAIHTDPYTDSYLLFIRELKG